ncbi:NCS2 family permease [Parvibaculum sp.]|uniref:NCS2 family permease n=1 Tax=Parvibaculum sp. TaxID=2024848 RepID=UPI002730455E|nr:NCS2 family permease [Parvibaculum sp.]MDP1627929.1 NCS2 family permease [Parvibaculum sp.]MDP2150927.1 NCS2 family permease [Parvibaculum sp.]MDP3327442.1 NCS2 family permease [Parvibaculum sp.]
MANGGSGVFERVFQLAANGTTIRTEVLAGATTYLTMAYIVFVNPAILAAAGMDFGAVFVATCLAAAAGSLIMGLYANYPVALAPGMGLNAYFAFVVVPLFGGDWRLALGCVFVSGFLFLLLSLSPLRERMVNSIPRSLKYGIGAGIGFFLALIGLKNAGIVAGDPATLVTLGDVGDAGALLACAGFVVLVALQFRRVPGAIMLTVLGVTVAAVILGLQEFKGVAAAPPSLAPTFLQMDLAGAFQAGFVTIIFVFLLVDLLDTTGTLVSVAQRAGLVDAEGNIPRLRKAMVADSSATIIGAALGTSTTTSYIESAAGVNAGGRTGLTAVIVAALFVLSLVFAPLAEMVPIYATAPALVFIACLMARSIADIDWEDVSETAPAIVTALAIPLTFSIATGIGLGVISYAAIKLLAGRWRDLNMAVIVIAAAFTLKLALQ